jgi:hypothetical protein
MSDPLYAWRIFRLVANPYGVTSIPASEITPALTSVFAQHQTRRWKGPGEDPYYPRWDTPRLQASCERVGHPAPQQDCTCGIYAYPDLLDVLKLIPNYCDDDMYAVGLIRGYGAKHNDGAVMMHDACMRFADVDLVGLAALGAGWRTGVLSRAAAAIGVRVKPLTELLQQAAEGSKVVRKQLVPEAVYLDALASGCVNVAVSAFVVDRHGRAYLRSDRECLDKKDSTRLDVSRTAEGRFEVYRSYVNEETMFLALPFDGDLTLPENSQRLAGEVGLFRNRRGFWLSDPANPQHLQLPPIHRYHLLDTLEIGKRLPVQSGMEFGKQGQAYLGRVVREDDLTRETNARAFLTRIDDCKFRLEFEGEGVLHIPTTVVDHRRHEACSLRMDTPVSSLAINGEPMEDARVPFDRIDLRGPAYQVKLGVSGD